MNRVASNRQMSFDVWWFDQIFKFWRFGQIFDQKVSIFHQIVKIHQKRMKIIWSKMKFWWFDQNNLMKFDEMSFDQTSNLFDATLP